MRVCHIVPSLEQRHGGPSVSVPNLAAAQAKLGQTVELLATTPGDFDCRIDQGLTVRAFPLGWPESLCVSRGLRHALYDSGPQVIHHHSLWLRPLHYAHRASKEWRASFVLSPRGMMSDWAWKHHRWKKALAEKFVHRGAFRAVSGWHATSSAEADEIRRRGFNQPICVAPNGVRQPTIDQLIAARAAWQQRCPAVRDQPVALFYSRFHKKKRVRELLDLWLSQPRDNWLLLMAGVPEDYPIAEIQGWIDAANAHERVAVFDGSTLPPPYGVASLFLLPSHSENFGLVIAEAMASGVPVIVTDSTPWSDVNLENLGWCVPWAEFGRTLEEALGEGTGALLQRGTRARTWVLREYSWEKAATDLIAFYQELGKNHA